MFEVGKRYDFELLDSYTDDGEPTITTYPGRAVLDSDGPLIKIGDVAGDMIVNTHSPLFFRATEKKK